jgi:large subunit ribosomal protein L25
MRQIEMSASVRNVTGKGPMRQLRMQGMTPAVVYGGGADAQTIQLETKPLMAQLLEFYRLNAVVTLKIGDGAEKSVVIGEVQTDPVRDTLIHVDFCEIDLVKSRVFKVPVTYQGIAQGVDMGGIMNVIHSEIVIEGKPLDIPDDCIIDVSEMNIGDDIKCGVISIPDTVKMITDPEAVAVAIMKPGAQEVEDEEEGEGEEGEGGSEAEAAPVEGSEE